MNKIVLLGRFVKDPELKHTEEGRVYCKFVIAVEENFKLADGRKSCDFIPIVAFGKKAEVICKYKKKGEYITVSGKLKIDKYEDQNGNKKYITTVIAEDFKFINTGNRCVNED